MELVDGPLGESADFLVATYGINPLDGLYSLGHSAWKRGSALLAREGAPLHILFEMFLIPLQA